METQNSIITHTAAGAGFELEARRYTYAGAPAFEIYGFVGRRQFDGAIAYYEDGPRGVEPYPIEDRITDFARFVYEAMFPNHFDLQGEPDPALLNPIIAELNVLIEDELIHDCMQDIPPAQLFKATQCEVGAWYFYLTEKGMVVIEYLPTACAQHDAYFVTTDTNGVITDIIEGARSWVQTDPFWGLKFVQAERDAAHARLQASLHAAIEVAIKTFNGNQGTVRYA